jgi:Lipocalin-like domain
MRTSIRGLWATIAALGAIVVSVPSQAQTATTKEQLAGTWQDVSFKATSGDKVGYPLGENPGGYAAFTPARFWLLLTDSSRIAPAAAAMTDGEAVSLMKSHAAYTGKYDVDPAQTPDGIKITVHVDAASNQALAGTNRVFYVRVEGDKLILKSPAIVVPTTGLTSIVQLQFVKAD